MAEVRIKIPKAQEGEIANIPSGDLGVSPKEAKARFEKIDNLLFGIIASVVISGIAVVVAVIGLFIDQMRYNNVAYKDYSQKLEERDQVLNDYKQQLIINEKLLQQISTKSEKKQ